MECSQIRKEFPDIKIPPCCESCHEDDATGFGEDLWFIINGVERKTCCFVANKIQEYLQKTIVVKSDEESKTNEN